MRYRYCLAVLAALAANLALTGSGTAATFTGMFSATQPGRTIVVGNVDGTGVHVVGHGDFSILAARNYVSIGDDDNPKPLRLVKLQGTRAVHTATLPCDLGAFFGPDGRHFWCELRRTFRRYLGDAVTGRIAPLPANISRCDSWTPRARALVCVTKSGVLELIATATRRVRILARDVLFAVPSPTMQTLAVVTKDRTGLKLIDVATGRARTIPTTGQVGDPHFSPDSKRIAYTTGGTGFVGIGARLTIRTLATGAVRRLAKVDVESAIWLTSRRLVMDIPTAYPGGVTVFDTGTVSSGGTGFRRLTHAGPLPAGQQGFFPRAWSLDGARLALAFSGIDLSVGYTVNPAGGGLRVLAQGQLRVAAVDPAGRFVYGTTNAHANERVTPDAFDLVQVGFAAGAKPVVVLRQAIRPSFAFVLQNR